MSLTVYSMTVYLVESFSFFAVHKIMVFLTIGGALGQIEYFRFNEYFRLWDFLPSFLFCIYSCLTF